MPELTPELAPQVIAACTENAEEAAGAIGRAFDGEFVLKAGEASPYASGKISGPGLMVALHFGEESLAIAMPAGDGLVPNWTQIPDTTGEEKLSTLAEELGKLLTPETLVADKSEARWTDDLAAAIEKTQPANDATLLEIEVAAGEVLGGLTMLWPVADAMAAYNNGASEASKSSDGSEAATADAAVSKSTVLRWNATRPRDFRDLPPNTVSALQVKALLAVNLAGKRMPLGEVVELGPGSIITFDKACDAPLEITIGDRSVAKGEAIKVGDRFGVRVLEMLLPDEHFRPMLPPKLG